MQHGFTLFLPLCCKCRVKHIGAGKNGALATDLPFSMVLQGMEMVWHGGKSNCNLSYCHQQNVPDIWDSTLEETCHSLGKRPLFVWVLRDRNCCRQKSPWNVSVSAKCFVKIQRCQWGEKH